MSDAVGNPFCGMGFSFEIPPPGAIGPSGRGRHDPCEATMITFVVDNAVSSAFWCFNVSFACLNRDAGDSIMLEVYFSSDGCFE